MEKIGYARIAQESRIKCLELIYKAQTSHIGSCFSAADIMAVLFEKIDLDKDKFVMSCGWKAAMLYYHLWRKGRVTEEELNSYCQPGSKFIGLAEPIIPEIPIAGGSMQMGLAGAVGLALAKKINEEDGTIYVLLSDGELAGGMIYESLLIINHHKLDNIKILIDNNGYQATDRTKDVLEWRLPFGVLHLNGHSYEEIEKGLDEKDLFPTIICFDTVKGKGVSFMESNRLQWHYTPPNKEQYRLAKQELCLN